MTQPYDAVAVDEEDDATPTKSQQRAAERMPKVWRGRRRYLLVALVVLGVVQAVLALVMALTVDVLLSGLSTTDPAAQYDTVPWGTMAGLSGAVLGIGLGRWMERVVAEDLGQDYVYEQRRRLVAAALHNIGNRSLGVVVTRASNDLTAVRNWIAQGIVPMLTALPLIAVILAGLAVTNWPVAVTVAIPLAITGLLMPFLARTARERARTVRRYRGRMSARIADTVQAGESVQVAGAVRRELNALDRDSSKVVGAAVQRARITGFIRALTVTAASLCTAGVVYLAVLGVIDVAGVASIMTLLGVMATPMSDLGRVVEYRQNFRAARRIIAPILNSARAVKRAVRAQERSWKAMQTASDDDTTDDPTDDDLSDEPRPACDYRSGVVIENLVIDRQALPDLHAKPGDRILLDSVDTEKIHAVLRSILIHGVNPLAQDDDEEHDSVVLIDGIEYGAAPPAVRRELVGACSIHVPLQRGSVQRLVSYRSPRASVEDVKAMLHRVGLSSLVYVEHKGLKTLLKNDGDPWSRADVARLKVARALFGEPALVVLENIDAALDAEGLAMLRRQLADYPGVVLFSSFAPERIFDDSDYRRWSLDSQDLDADLPQYLNRRNM